MKYQKASRNPQSSFTTNRSPSLGKSRIAHHHAETAGADGEMERWEKIPEVMKSGEMPPDDEKQQTAAERETVQPWIEQGMRDPLGVDLDLIQDLPQDPEKPCHFNNTEDANRAPIQALKIKLQALNGTDYLFIEVGGFQTNLGNHWKSPWFVMKRE